MSAQYDGPDIEFDEVFVGGGAPSDQPPTTQTVAATTDEAAIDDLLSLHKAMRKLQTVRSRISENELTAKHEHELIDEWLHTATERDRRDAAYWEGQITAYALRRRQETNGRDKSLTGPHGRVETRELPVQYARNDEELDAWAAARGYVRIIPAQTETDWARIKRESVATAGGLLWNGEPVPGVSIVGRPPDVKVVTWD